MDPEGKRFWRRVYVALCLLPIVAIGVMFVLSEVVAIGATMTSDDWWGLLIISVGFAIVGLLVEGAAS